MRIHLTLAAACLWSAAQAGELHNGEWTVTACGDKPQPPAVNVQDAESYNQTVNAINQWQTQANAYYECLIKEANQDTAAIAGKAKQEQSGYQQTAEGIAATLDSARKKLDNR